ncbi:mannose-6-phosphate isomerase [Fulvivirga sp. M361]|uniref:type I phosphomannose isomerase catalytic subunit n=1 Tax=Fulvivirga sp. M361 TaxID=2594266 RepID=UPI00117A9AA1|nr:type I phosphomannose isomerase catalytic subunit [Fulvivirga sp. M361]TRX60900.1 mannose-6-phosphate isomerase [Fulvivirga sp. M361]
MSEVYPLRFETIFKEKIWGGQKVRSILNKDYHPLDNCGETWELSAVKGNVSIIANGALKGQPLDQIVTQHGPDLLGKRLYNAFHGEFPLLIKFLDANEDLSVQVHPNDDLAGERHNSLGKTEMWYIMQADPGATLITGFNQPMDSKRYQQYVKDNKVMEILNKEPVTTGDVFFIPAGRVHTIGKGILLAEIQQTSDVTYRIYDFDRPDKDGNLRELHNDLAVDAIDFKTYDSYRTEYKRSRNESATLVKSKYFTTNKMILDELHTRDYSKLDSFVIYICLNGKATLKCQSFEEEIEQGQVYLIPASVDSVSLQPDSSVELLEVWA